MAWTGNFKTQIEDLAGTLSTADDSAIQQWIVDGCYDVFNKFVNKYGEEEIFKFAVKSGVQTSNDIDVDEVRSILSVVRNGVVAVKGEWRLQEKYADNDSIYAATAGSPVWFLDNNMQNRMLTIYPAPDGVSPTRYYYLPEYSVTSWDTSTSSIANYPSEYYYNVMLYASLQVLQRRLLDISSSALNIAAVPPDVPVFRDIVLPDFGTAPVYNTQSLPDDVQGEVSSFITDEDVELAQIKLQQFQASISEWQASMQNELNNFNDANTEYQANINKAMKEADLDNRDDEKALQLYQAEVGEYQAEVQAEVQDFMFTQRNYEWIEGQYLKVLGMYQQSFGMPAGETENR